jgi:hypothetical protein
MKPLLALLSVVAVVLAAGSAIGSSTPELLKSRARNSALNPGTTYGASLFTPAVRITSPDRGWRGNQCVSRGYDWLELGWTSVDGTSRGGIRVLSDPRSTQSAPTTLHKLETERADSPLVGLKS